MLKYVHLFTFIHFPPKTLIHKICINIITSTPAIHFKHLAEHIGKCAHVCFSYYALHTRYNMTDHRTLYPCAEPYFHNNKI